MEINATGFSARELAPNRSNLEQELTQKTMEKDEDIKQTPKELEPRPIERTGGEKLGRIDVYV